MMQGGQEQQADQHREAGHGGDGLQRVDLAPRNGDVEHRPVPQAQSPPRPEHDFTRNEPEGATEKHLSCARPPDSHTFFGSFFQKRTKENKDFFLKKEAKTFVCLDSLADRDRRFAA